MVGRKRIIDE